MNDGNWSRPRAPGDRPSCRYFPTALLPPALVRHTPVSGHKVSQKVLDFYTTLLRAIGSRNVDAVGIRQSIATRNRYAGAVSLFPCILPRLAGWYLVLSILVVWTGPRAHGKYATRSEFGTARAVTVITWSSRCLAQSLILDRQHCSSPGPYQRTALWSPDPSAGSGCRGVARHVNPSRGCSRIQLLHMKWQDQVGSSDRFARQIGIEDANGRIACQVL